MTPPATTPFTIPQLEGYFAGKGADGTVHTIINRIPPHEVFISLFLGHCAVLRHIKPAERTIGFDLDPAVVSCWQRYAPKWVHVEQRDALTYLANLVEQSRLENIDESTFLFLDPPYLEGTTRGAIRYDHVLSYDDHVKMLRTLPALKCNVMLCGLPNLLNDHHLAGWHTLQYRNKTRRGMQVEQLWMNYPPPERLHDTRYVGETFRERERIKRTVKAIQRIIDKQAGNARTRSPIERQHIIELIKAANP